MPTLAGKLVKYPARTSLYWYLGFLILGAALLRLPVSSGNPGAPISVLDAVFTATSALCVTGLGVRSTPDDFSLFGQVVILALIQIGGVGIMTLTTFVIAQLGSQAGLRHQAVVMEVLGANPKTNLRLIVTRVLGLTLLIELLGALLLLPRFLETLDWPMACWYALFHSVSAFCNAGFGLYNDSVVSMRGDPLVNFVLMALIVLGGLGFPVLTDLLRVVRSHPRHLWSELRLHSKLTLVMTGWLIVGGALALFLLERDGALAGKPVGERLLIPLFQSVTCRTAGFNSIGLSELSNASLFVMILLMLVGAGACSTAGGLKVSTVAILILNAWSRFTGARHVNVFRRTIPQTSMDRAMATVVLFLVLAAAALTLLLFVEQGDQARQDRSFLQAAFEVTSALCTVGLTVDYTVTLSDAGRWILIVLMFLGRLGPITVFAALAIDRKTSPNQFMSETPLVG